MSEQQKQLAFFSILNLGVTHMLKKHNYTISSYRTLEEAFAQGALQIKEKLAQERASSRLPDNYLPNLVQIAFPRSGFMRNRETGSIETRVTWHMDHPGHYDCAELHIFLNNSMDSFKHLLDCLGNIANRVEFDSEVILELMGPSDTRVCSALLSLYGDKGLRMAHGIASFLDKNLHTQRRGYSLDILYPPKGKYWTSCCFGPGKFQERKQELFRRLFMSLYSMDILHLSELKYQFESVQQRFLHPQEAQSAV